MDAEYIKHFGDLQKELDDAKHTLVTLNDNIRRVIGRNPKEIRGGRNVSLIEYKRDDSDFAKDQHFFKHEVQANDAKNNLNRIYSFRKNFDEVRPRLNSRVIRELPSRQEIVDAQGNDSESKARNRRMFGSLMGTLHKFCQEESLLKQKEDKKAKIERKLEEQQLKERELLRKERESLFIDRKRKQMQIKSLEQKMCRIKDFEVWESSMYLKRHYIRTKSKPHIYFKPKCLSKDTEKLLLESQMLADSLIKTKHDAVNKELIELEQQNRGNDEENMEQYNYNGNRKSCKSSLVKQPDKSANEGHITDATVSYNSSQGKPNIEENATNEFTHPSLNSSVKIVKKN